MVQSEEISAKGFELEMLARKSVPVQCADAAVLASIIDRTGQLEDLLKTEGMESERAGFFLPIPSFHPDLADTIDRLNHALAESNGTKRTGKQLQTMVDVVRDIRADSADFLTAANTKCILALLTTKKPPERS